MTRPRVDELAGELSAIAAQARRDDRAQAAALADRYTGPMLPASVARAVLAGFRAYFELSRCARAAMLGAIDGWAREAESLDGWTGHALGGAIARAARVDDEPQASDGDAN